MEHLEGNDIVGNQQPVDIAATGLNAPVIEQIIANIVTQAKTNGGAPEAPETRRDLTAPTQKEVDGAFVVCRIEDSTKRDIIQVTMAFGTLESFCLLEEDEAVDAWLKMASQKPVPNHLSLAEVQIYNLKGLAFWVRDRMS